MNKLLNPEKLTAFSLLESKNIKKEMVWSFILAAGSGCISGSVENWPQLKPAIRWSMEHIQKLEAQVTALSEAKENIRKILQDARNKQYGEKKRGLDDYGQKVILRDAVLEALSQLEGGKKGD